MTSKTDTRHDKLRAAHDKLQDAVAEIVSGDDWKRMLSVGPRGLDASISEYQQGDPEPSEHRPLLRTSAGRLVLSL